MLPIATKDLLSSYSSHTSYYAHHTAKQSW